MNILKRFNKTALAVATALVIGVATTPAAMAGGGGLTGGATEMTQLLNNGELITVAIDEAENLAYTIQQYQIMYENAKKLTDFNKQQAIAALIDLAQVVAQGRAIAYSSANLDEEFQAEHRDFEYYENLQRGESNYNTYSERYRDWAQVNHDSIRGALRAAGLQAAQFADESAAISAIENQAQSAAGMTQVLQAGASISAHQVEQLQKLRQLVMAQIQMQANYSAGQVDRQAESDADLQRALKPATGLDEDRSGGVNINGSIR